MKMLQKLIDLLPSVSGPEGHLGFSSRLKWVAGILFIFFIMGEISLWGISEASRTQFQFFEMILGSSIGSILTLGIGPIVTASIILQLLSGSQILKIDTKTEEGKALFQGYQKLLAIAFCVFEAIAFVLLGAVQPATSGISIVFFLIVQLTIGALILIFMDEIISKWGLGSGISLFIVAGVARQIFIGALNPLSQVQDAAGGITFSLPDIASGLFSFGSIPQFIEYLAVNQVFDAFVALLPFIATILVFIAVVYIQSIKVEIPLAFGAFRGFSRRWPLKLLYTSNIPVILMAALLANLQLVSNSIATEVTESGIRCGLLGCFSQDGAAVSGFAQFIQPPSDLSLQIIFLTAIASVLLVTGISIFTKKENISKIALLSSIIGFSLGIVIANTLVGLPTFEIIMRAMSYFVLLVIGATVFSVIWVSTSGMDSKSMANQIQGMGMQVPGFRRDPRIVEQVLDRYIPSLAIISGLIIGSIAAISDFTGAIGSGIGILLAVTIIYNLYEHIGQRYMEDMNPEVRKFFGN